MAMTTVDIEYCVPCGMRDRAQDLQATLLAEFGQRLTAVSLVTGDGGVFRVAVDGEEIYDKAREEYDTDLIVDRVGDRVGTTA
jgi:selenoprotein W-related protein